MYLLYMNPTSIAATIWSVEASYIVPLYLRSSQIFYEMLACGVGHSEEAIFTYLYDRYPEMFELFYGDYPSCAMNYHFIRRDLPSIRALFIGEAKLHDRHDLALACEESIRRGAPFRTKEDENYDAEKLAEHFRRIAESQN